MPPRNSNTASASSLVRISKPMKLSAKLRNSSSASTGRASGLQGAAQHAAVGVQHFFKVIKASSLAKNENEKIMEQQQQQQQASMQSHGDGHTFAGRGVGLGLTPSFQAKQPQQAASGCTFSVTTGMGPGGGTSLTVGSCSLDLAAGPQQGRTAAAVAAGHHHLEEDDDGDDYLDDADSHIWSSSSVASATTPAALAQRAQQDRPAWPQELNPLPSLSSGQPSDHPRTNGLSLGEFAPKGLVQQQAVCEPRLSSMTGAHTPMRMPVCPSGYGGLLQQQQQQQHLPMPTPPNTTVMHTQAVPSSAAPATRLDGTHPLPAAALAAAQRDQTAAAAVPETALAASLRSSVNKRTPDGTGLLAAQYASAAVSQRKELAPDVDAAAPDAEEGVSFQGLYVIPGYVPKPLPQVHEPEE